MAHRLNIRLAAAGTLLLLAGTTTACGGSDGPPTDASKKDFCAAVADPDIAAADMSDKTKLEKAFKKWEANLKKVGTPENTPDEAREGFEIALREFDKIDWTKDLQAIAKQMQKLEGDLAKAENKKVEAFDKFQEKTCKS